VRPTTGTPGIQGKEGYVEGADALGLIAEVGIAIAGFAGVVAALRAPAGRIRPYAAFRIGVLLALSASAVLLSMLPSTLHFAGVSSHGIWAVSSSVMVLLIVAIFLFALRATSRLQRAGEEGPPGLRLFGPFILATYVSIIGLQIANVAFQQQLWPFHLGLLLMTALSLVVFAYILFAPTRGEVQA
jgi:hypothetical protein